ncbi:hypothetical protein M9H77_23538 [Catharanthus roseus]|uniref:Uncharacterized protein n=1 Tax=Catharanthus roseus TaxID=4058 RepID=A0ACC0AV39_CATRO|nr:hypothetical protein M9H77_23538 [Catharanthus roseus]
MEPIRMSLDNPSHLNDSDKRRGVKGRHPSFFLKVAILSVTRKHEPNIQTSGQDFTPNKEYFVRKKRNNKLINKWCPVHNEICDAIWMVLCSFLTLGVLPWHGKPQDLPQHLAHIALSKSRDRCRMIEVMEVAGRSE